MGLGFTQTSPEVTKHDLPLQDLTQLFPPFPIPKRSPNFQNCRVGVILDEFSAQSFGFEWTTIQLTQMHKGDQLEDLDFVFVESAWNGNNGEWKYQLVGPTGPKQTVINLLSECSRRGIPTVFWNKEDPPHFEDFLPLARLFDVVFTSDARLLSKYRQELGHDRVDVLPFAAQPAIHSPVRMTSNKEKRDIAFAGMYFAHKFPERREQIELLLGAAEAVSSRMEYGLDIFSRFHGHDDRYQFPASLAHRVVGSLPYQNLLSAYRQYKVFLNVNSVVDSPSMCARRIFEITASGTPVVTTKSAATEEFFPDDEVPQPETQADAEDILRALVRNPELRDRTVHKAQRRIWNEHTYTHRAKTIMAALDITDKSSNQTSVSAVVATNRPFTLPDILDTQAKQSHKDLELVLVTHGFEVPADFAERASEIGIENLTVIHADTSEPLGSCLNIGIAASSGAFVAKMDDDDVYGSHYLSDQLAALNYSHADLVGKQAHYLHLRGKNIVMCRFPEREHQYTDLVMGPTMMARRELFINQKFSPLPTGEDTDFQKRLVSDGGQIYSADRFNFIQVRSSHSHTWKVSDGHLLANSNIHAFDYAPEHYLF